jgi:hypothetical protein
MTYHRKFLEAESFHDLDAIQRHRALGIVLVIFAAFGFTAVAVTAQVGDHESILLGQIGSDLDQVACDCGAPCSSRTGGPWPPDTTWIVAPEV